jgi:hypothetical protein
MIKQINQFLKEEKPLFFYVTVVSFVMGGLTVLLFR